MQINYCYLTSGNRMISISDAKLIRDSSESYVKFTAVIDNVKYNLVEHSDYLADPVSCKKLSIISNTESLPPVLISDVYTAIRLYLESYVPVHDNSYLSIIDLIRMKYHNIKFLLIDRENNTKIDQCHSYTGLVNLLFYRAAYDKHSLNTDRQYYIDLIDLSTYYRDTSEAQKIINSIRGTADEMLRQVTTSFYENDKEGETC